MAQDSLLFGKPDGRILRGHANSPPEPPSFADFRFNTIGQQPQLLKRISAPEPHYQYQDHSSPEPSDQGHSVQSTPKVLSRPTLLETLGAQSESQDATMNDAPDDMVVDTHPVQASGTLFLSHPAVARGLSHFSTTRLNPARAPLGWSGNTTPINPPLSNTEGVAPFSSQAHPQAPIPNSPQTHETNSESSNPISQPVLVTSNSVLTVQSSPANDPTQVVLSPIFSDEEPVTARPSPSIHEHDSPYTALRTLQSRLFASLSSFNPPQIDNSHALLLVQAANSHSADALSTAHRVQTLSQQALTAARDAANVAQECLAAAEQAKAHASVAVSAVEHIGNSDSGVLKSEWEWKTITAELRDGLSALGQWLGEREGEEAARRREVERAEKERKHKESVESAMRITNRSLPPQIVRAMSVEVAQRTTASEACARSSRFSVQTSSPDAHMNDSAVSRASAELEADAARRAWSLEHRTSPSTNAKAIMSASLAPEEQHVIEEDPMITQIMEAQKQQQQGQGQQKQQEEAEVRRGQDLNQLKLEVAQFHVKERERQERLQTEEAARRAAEGERLQKEAELLEEQRKKARETEAMKAADARGGKQARLEQEGLEKQKLEEAAKEQARLEQQQRHEAAREQARFEQQRTEKAAARQTAERRAQEEEIRKAAELKAAEEAANAVLTKAYDEAQALEQQKRREVEELKQKRKQQDEAAQARAKELEAEDKRLREEQEKKRQEIMLNKQRATAETAARILADRAQKEKEKNGGMSATPKSISPPISISARTSSTSQSPSTHPLPLPGHQPSSTNIGNLTAKKTVALQSGEALKLKDRALSGGVRLGTGDELPQSSQSQPQSLTEPTLPPSPTLTHSTALGLRDKIPPIPKRNKSSVQIASQENNIPPAKRLGKTQPPANGRSTPLVKPPSQGRSETSAGPTPEVASSVPVTPGRKSAVLPTVAGDRSSLILPTSTLSRDDDPPPNNNNHQIREPVPEQVSVHCRGQDGGNLHVIPKSKASHASPQAQAANLRFVKDEGGVLWNKYLKPDPFTKVKSEHCGENDELPTTPMKNDSGSTSPVILKRCLIANAESTKLSPVIATPTQTTPIMSSSAVPKPNPAALNPSQPKPRPSEPAASNSAGSKVPVSPSIVRTSSVSAASTAIPPKPKFPKFKKLKNPAVNNNQPGPNNGSTNLPSSKGSISTNATHTDSTRSLQSLLLSATLPFSFDPRTPGNDSHSSFDDSSAIAPVIQGMDGWDAWGGSPPVFSGSLQDRGPAGSTRSDVDPGWDSAPRRPTLRRVDHYSPPPSRGYVPLEYPHHPERALPVQDQRFLSRPRLAQPRTQGYSGPSRDRSPPLQMPPSPERSPPMLGKRHYREDDTLQRQPIRRQRKSNSQPEMEDQVPRPNLARTPPLSERRSPTPEPPGGLQSRISGHREVRTYNGDVYRPNPTAATTRSQPRSYDSFMPNYNPMSRYPDYRPPISTMDPYSNMGGPQVTETRPDLLNRMDNGSNQSFSSSGYISRGRPSYGNGAFRGRRGRGGSAGGGRPLEERLSNSYDNNNPLPLAHRLQSPSRYQ